MASLEDRYCSALKMLEKEENDTQVPSDLIRKHKQGLADSPGEMAVIFGGLDPKNKMKYIKKCAKNSVEFFMGTWREGYREYNEIYSIDRARKEWNWYEGYRMAISCALACEESELYKALFHYMNTDLPYDEGAFRHIPEDNLYQIQFGLSMRDKKPSQVIELRKKIQKTRIRRPKLNLAALQAIENMDKSEFEKYIIQALKIYKKNNYKPDHAWLSVSFDISALWSLAKIRGLQRPRLPSDLSHLLLVE